MTKSEIIEYWRKGARDALDMARLAFKAEKTSALPHSLFTKQ